MPPPLDDLDVAASPPVTESDILAQQSMRELEEARKEHMELMVAQQKFSSKELDTANAEQRLQYLLQQSEVFAHFLAGTVAAGGKKGKRSSASTGNRGKKGRMTEAEEDAQMLKSAQLKRRTVRLEQQPSSLAPHCKMHGYQLEGLNWLIKLHDHGINGILADEMGLGKTLQTISMLAYLRESRGIIGPHIVIVPKSVVGNWIKELNMWCPSIRAIRMGGTREERKSVVANDLPLDARTRRHTFDVLVTSYEGIVRESTPLSRIQWKYLIIDEAHRIKNENSSLSRVVRMMTTQFRVLITGTPLQNNLHELWALLNFLMPDIFGNAEQFDAWFSLSEEEGKQNVIRKLHTVLRPFMLRRVKKDVACSVPPKKETKLFVGLTKMQQQWYTKVLSKDADSLNSLGGPDKIRLLNIMMQLRKVCNHPYLFDGAEAGPPYTDGPHLWENCGKMMLINKLLPKLKANGSRVLIFSSMTRVLDIIEDYLRLQSYQYCRIDGSTDGESRDSQMEEFNRPNSPKFCFMLTTRAGGLGINLATADIVILYDSDWNPQVDLQAMDRAHRIGQTKPVQVFRFITEGTIEEKIIERADRKLFLDAAVIQQGRLAEKHSSLDKKDLMHMVRFGADQIISGKGGTYTDDDIDAIIKHGEERTEAIQAELKTNAQHDLASFSLSGEDDHKMDTFDFGGKNYRGKSKSTSGNFINLPQRERKRNYDVNEYFRETMNSGVKYSSDPSRKKRKGPNLQDFQLYNLERLDVLLQVERDMSQKKDEQMDIIREFRDRAKQAHSKDDPKVLIPEGESKEELSQKAEELEKTIDQFALSPEEVAEKDQLLAEGFPDWSRKDFKAFCSSMERHGRYDVENIVRDVKNECSKDENEIKRYFVSFWLYYRRIDDWKKILDRIERGEKKIHRLRQIHDEIHERVERHLEGTFGPIYMDRVEEIGKADTDSKKLGPKLPTPAELLNQCWPSIRINYAAGTKNRSYTEEEDAFLLCMMHRHGYGAAERIRMEIRRAWQFRFDWFFKSRNAQEIQKRCDILVKIIERENEELRKKEEELEKRIQKEEEERKAAAQQHKEQLQQHQEQLQQHQEQQQQHQEQQQQHQELQHQHHQELQHQQEQHNQELQHQQQPQQLQQQQHIMQFQQQQHQFQQQQQFAFQPSSASQQPIPQQHFGMQSVQPQYGYMYGDSNVNPSGPRG